jgi:hypothetical protein
MRFVIGEYYLGKAIEGMSAFHPKLPRLTSTHCGH